MSVKTYVRNNLAVMIMCDNVNWVQFNRGTEICSVRLRHDKAGAILVQGVKGETILLFLTITKWCDLNST